MGLTMRDIPFQLGFGRFGASPIGRPSQLGKATLRVAFAALVLAALGWSLFDMATQEIHEVRIHGALSEAERNEVGTAATAAIVAGRRSASDIVEAVQSLGWSRAVRAWRHWPDRMHVDVTREPLAARWGDGAYLTTSGEVVALPADIAGDNLPTLRAEQASGVEAMRLYGLLHGAAAGADLAVVELAENALGEWSVELDNDVNVMLGSSELSTRFARFLTVWEAELANGAEPVRRVDTRYPAGVAVAWAEPAPDELKAATQGLAEAVEPASDTAENTPEDELQTEALALANLPALPAELATTEQATTSRAITAPLPARNE